MLKKTIFYLILERNYIFIVLMSNKLRVGIYEILIKIIKILIIGIDVFFFHIVTKYVYFFSMTTTI